MMSVHYNRKSPGYWYAYVNGVYKDSYGNHANGLNVIELNNNDQVNFFYATENESYCTNRCNCGC